jgi:hypothetical protein
MMEGVCVSSGPARQSHVRTRLNWYLFDGLYVYYPYDSAGANAITITGNLNNSSDKFTGWLQPLRLCPHAHGPRPWYPSQSFSISFYLTFARNTFFNQADTSMDTISYLITPKLSILSAAAIVGMPVLVADCMDSPMSQLSG